MQIFFSSMCLATIANGTLSCIPFWPITPLGLAPPPRFPPTQATEAEAGAYRRVGDFTQNNEDKATATLAAQEEYSNTAALEPPSDAARSTSRAEEAGDTEAILQKETTGKLGDGLFDDLEFNDCLSQEI